MEGDKNDENSNRKDRKKAQRKKQIKSREDSKVEMTSSDQQTEDSKDQINKKDEQFKPKKTDHELTLLNFNFKNKYKPYHDREYGVNYNRDFMAYNYRGYNIQEPRVKFSNVAGYNPKPERWVQYMSHAEKHPAIPSRMFYHPNDNSFVIIVLLSLLLLILLTLAMCIVAKFVKAFQNWLEVYYMIWVPAALGVIFTLIVVHFIPCSRRFPWSLIMLIINAVSTIFMCMYVTATHDSCLPLFALASIAVVVLVMIFVALCGFDMRKKSFVILMVLLAALLTFGLLEIGERNFIKYMTLLYRRENLMFFGVILYVLSMTYILIQIIDLSGYLRLKDDDYAIGTFLLYMSIPCLLFKLMSYMGIYQETKPCKSARQVQSRYWHMHPAGRRLPWTTDYY